MRLTLTGNRQNLLTLIETALYSDATRRADSRVPRNVATLAFFMPDVAANSGQTVSWGSDELVIGTGVGEKGSILPAQRISIYEFETNQGSLQTLYVQSSANNVVLDVDYKVA